MTLLNLSPLERRRIALQLGNSWSKNLNGGKTKSGQVRSTPHAAPVQTKARRAKRSTSKPMQGKKVVGKRVRTNSQGRTKELRTKRLEYVKQNETQQSSASSRSSSNSGASRRSQDNLLERTAKQQGTEMGNVLARELVKRVQHILEDRIEMDSEEQSAIMNLAKSMANGVSQQWRHAVEKECLGTPSQKRIHPENRRSPSPITNQNVGAAQVSDPVDIHELSSSLPGPTTAAPPSSTKPKTKRPTGGRMRATAKRGPRKAAFASTRNRDKYIPDNTNVTPHSILSLSSARSAAKRSRDPTSRKHRVNVSNHSVVHLYASSKVSQSRLRGSRKREQGPVPAPRGPRRAASVRAVHDPPAEILPQDASSEEEDSVDASSDSTASVNQSTWGEGKLLTNAESSYVTDTVQEESQEAHDDSGTMSSGVDGQSSTTSENYDSSSWLDDQTMETETSMQPEKLPQRIAAKVDTEPNDMGDETILLLKNLERKLHQLERKEAKIDHSFRKEIEFYEGFVKGEQNGNLKGNMSLPVSEAHLSQVQQDLHKRMKELEKEFKQSKLKLNADKQALLVRIKNIKNFGTSAIQQTGFSESESSHDSNPEYDQSSITNLAQYANEAFDAIRGQGTDGAEQSYSFDGFESIDEEEVSESIQYSERIDESIEEISQSRFNDEGYSNSFQDTASVEIHGDSSKLDPSQIESRSIRSDQTNESSENVASVRTDHSTSHARQQNSVSSDEYAEDDTIDTAQSSVGMDMNVFEESAAIADGDIQDTFDENDEQTKSQLESVESIESQSLRAGELAQSDSVSDESSLSMDSYTETFDETGTTVKTAAQDSLSLASASVQSASSVAEYPSFSSIPSNLEEGSLSRAGNEDQDVVDEVDIRSRAEFKAKPESELEQLHPDGRAWDWTKDVSPLYKPSEEDWYEQSLATIALRSLIKFSPTEIPIDEKFHLMLKELVTQVNSKRSAQCANGIMAVTELFKAKELPAELFQAVLDPMVRALLRHAGRNDLAFLRKLSENALQNCVTKLKGNPILLNCLLSHSKSKNTKLVSSVANHALTWLKTAADKFDFASGVRKLHMMGIADLAFGAVNAKSRKDGVAMLKLLRTAVSDEDRFKEMASWTNNKADIMSLRRPRSKSTKGTRVPLKQLRKSAIQKAKLGMEGADPGVVMMTPSVPVMEAVESAAEDSFGSSDASVASFSSRSPDRPVPEDHLDIATAEKLPPTSSWAEEDQEHHRPEGIGSETPVQSKKDEAETAMAAKENPSSLVERQTTLAGVRETEEAAEIPQGADDQGDIPQSKEANDETFLMDDDSEDAELFEGAERSMIGEEQAIEAQEKTEWELLIDSISVDALKELMVIFLDVHGQEIPHLEAPENIEQVIPESHLVAYLGLINETLENVWMRPKLIPFENPEQLRGYLRTQKPVSTHHPMPKVHEFDFDELDMNTVPERGDLFVEEVEIVNHIADTILDDELELFIMELVQRTGKHKLSQPK